MLALALAVGGGWYARHHLLSDNAHPYNRVQRIALVSPQRSTPPPDDKPKQEPPKELEAPSPLVNIEAPAPDPAAGEPPHDDQLGVDADGEGAGDGFGLMAKRGGRDITTLGGGGAGGQGAGMPAIAARFNFGGYGRLVSQRLLHELNAMEALRAQVFVADVWIWVDPRGRIERVELPGGSEHPDIDNVLRSTFARMPTLPEPPSGLPQPLRLRVTAKGVDAQP